MYFDWAFTCTIEAERFLSSVQMGMTEGETLLEISTTHTSCSTLTTIPFRSTYLWDTRKKHEKPCSLAWGHETLSFSAASAGVLSDAERFRSDVNMKGQEGGTSLEVSAI